ncbi:unnamed protein product [Caretta caretta]
MYQNSTTVQGGRSYCSVKFCEDLIVRLQDQGLGALAELTLRIYGGQAKLQRPPVEVNWLSFRALIAFRLAGPAPAEEQSGGRDTLLRSHRQRPEPVRCPCKNRNRLLAVDCEINRPLGTRGFPSIVLRSQSGMTTSGRKGVRHSRTFGLQPSTKPSRVTQEQGTEIKAWELNKRQDIAQLDRSGESSSVDILNVAWDT